ncbi:rhomboid family intramembrane serine protease [Pasteurellaceae bacterium LIM206]|nr:rhomboid family intramembrane serine protease [Pasteurellaceae bacterium LIM206]
MQLLFRSTLPRLAIQFRDFVRAKYRVELLLQTAKNAQGQEEIAVFYAENAPYFAEIVQACRDFLQNPLAEQYQQAGWYGGDTQTVNYSLKNLTDGSATDFKSVLTGTGKFTVFVTALCLLIYVLQLLGFSDQIMELLHYPASFAEDGQLWRYFTHSLVHLSLWHIAFNLVWWWIFAGAIERRFGSFKLILLYFVSAIISGICQNFASGPNFFGLSGVVYAVLGFVFIVDKFGSRQSSGLPEGFFKMLIVGIVFGFISPVIGVYMGNSAHISGLIVGLLAGFLQIKRQPDL